jgi:glycosyltransferase involved in cell wall biosynthesis
VIAVAPADDSVMSLEDMGVELHPLEMEARGVSPIRDFQLLLKYRRILRNLRPDLFLGFTVKPNIYGSMAARSAGIPAINTISGLGTGFLSSVALEFLVSRLYRVSLSGSHRVFFHNDEDRNLFVDRGIVQGAKAAVVSGSGVNLEEFSPTPAPTANLAPVFLFIGRMLKDKGAEEFLSAAATVRSKAPVQFRMIGAVEEHPKAVPVRLIQQAVEAGIVELLPPTTDVRPFIAASDCVVLPSYREGLPRVLIEAAAMGKPAIATDVAGCRDAVDPSSTGYLCEARSAKSLADAMERFISLPRAEREEMGLRARAKAVHEFSDEAVVKAYLEAIGELCGPDSANRSRRAAA